jgi:hypothetical protein
MGDNSGFTGTIGSCNTMLGYYSGQYNNGDAHTFVGYNSGTTGSVGNTGNVCIGYQSGMNELGNYNSSVGYEAGMTGYLGNTGNICIGYQSGQYSIGNFNTFVGYQAGYTGTTLYTGDNLTCIGQNAYPSYPTISNEITLGNAYVDKLRCAVGTITTLSDMRDKKDIEPIIVGIEFINQLQPSKYRWDRRDWYMDGISDGSKKKNDFSSGFIAQQLDEVQTNNNAEYLNLVYKSNPEKLEINSTNLLPVIIKALQDLSAENADLKARIAILEKNFNI